MNSEQPDWPPRLVTSRHYVQFDEGEIPKEKTMDWNSVQQVVRTAVQFAAGYLVSAGLIDGTGSELFIGMGMSVAAFVWWMIWNRKQETVA